METDWGSSRWEIKRLADVADIDSGSGFPLQYQGRTEETFPFFKVGDMTSEGNETEMVVCAHAISENVRQVLRAKAFPAGAIVFPKIGGAMTTNKKRLLIRPSCVDNNVMAVSPSTAVESRFLLLLFLNKNLLDFANDSNPPSIRKTTVENWQIPIPPLTEPAATCDANRIPNGPPRQSPPSPPLPETQPMLNSLREDFIKS